MAVQIYTQKSNAWRDAYSVVPVGRIGSPKAVARSACDG
jgi:hypothetical protein